jgi:aromatic ring-opening dioxygenase catalytic subunit (LigB family)
VSAMSLRMPVAFVPHGGGPVTHVDLGLPPAEVSALAAYFRRVGRLPPQAPAALLVVSAHWEAPVPTVMTSPRPPMLYDYGGFSPDAYAITWPAPGDPALASRARALLGGAGFATAEDASRGFDHGAFTPLKQAFPDARIPAVQLSLKHGLDAAEHLAIGRALAPLRDEGVFIVGSGDTFHNMRAFRGGPSALEPSMQFNAWLDGVVTGPPASREAQLANWVSAPHARFCHPREDHLIPLMVVAGAAGSDAGAVTWRGSFMGTEQAGYHFGHAATA